MKNRFFKLLRDNAQAKAREPFKAELSGDEATIVLYDVIVSDDYWGGVSAESFLKEIKSISASTIHLRINSPGGDVFAGRAIEAAIREHPSNIIAHIDGYAASAASYVALAADEVEMSKGAFFMIHKAWTVAVGNADELMDSAALLEKIDASLVATYCDATGLSEGKVIEMMAAETWLNAEESVELGFANRIAKSAPKACKTWNLAAYDKAPKQTQKPENNEDPKAKQPEQKPEPKNSKPLDRRKRYERFADLYKNFSDSGSRVAKQTSGGIR